MMDYMSIKETAKKWGVSPRRVQILCAKGEIPGTKRMGHAWLVPASVQKPTDGRTKQARHDAADGLPHLPLPRKNPLLIFSDLYQNPGTADEVIASLSDYPEAARLMRLQFDNQQGNIDHIYEESQYFLKAHSGFNAVIGAGSQLAMSAIWRGDITLWRKARQHIYEAPCKNEEEINALPFWIASLDSSVYNVNEYPDWFTLGRFDTFHPDSYCVARIFYVRYLYINAHRLAKGEINFNDVYGFGLMRTLPYIIEPMISQAKIEKTLLSEIYLHMMGATVYHNLGENKKAIEHIDQAIHLCLPDRLFGALIEYRTPLDGLVDERLALADKNALKKLTELHRQRNAGWIRLHNILLERNVSEMLTVREREVAKLAAFGLSNMQIAERLSIEISSVKSYIFSAMNKVGANKRTELGMYI